MYSNADSLPYSITVFLSCIYAEDTSNWHVPENVKARLGKGNINEIQYTPDGKILAVATDIGIWLYDTDTYKEIALVGAHTGEINSIDFSADGSILAYDSGSNVVIWDMLNSSQKTYIAGTNDNDVLSAAISPDGRTIAGGTSYGNTYLYDVETGIKKATYSIRGHNITGVEFSPDGQSLLIEGTDSPRTDSPRSKSILLIDVNTHKEIGRITVDDDDMNGIAFSPDGKKIVSASQKKDNLLLWDIQHTPDNEKNKNLNCLHSRSVTFSPDSSMIAVGGYAVKLYDVDTGKQIGFHSASPISVAFSPDGKTLASATYTQIYLWDIDSAKPLKTINIKGRDEVKSVAISPDGRTFASGGFDECVTLWDAETGILKERFTFDTGVVNTVAFSPDGNTLAVGTDGVIDLLNIGTSHKKSIPIEHLGRVLSLNFSPDGNTIACAGDNSLVTLIDTATHEQKAELTGHKGQVNRVVFNPSGTLLASGGDDKQMILWDTDTGAKVYSSVIHDSKVEGEVWSLAFSPDGNTLAIGGRYGRIVLKDINTYKHRAIWDSVREISDIAYSIDGENIITASADGLHLWDVEKGKTVAAFVGHEGNVTSAEFNPADETIVSSGVDGTVRIWNETGGKFKDIATGFDVGVRSIAYSPNGKMFATTGGKTAVSLWNSTTYQLKSEFFVGPFGPIVLAFSPDGNQIATGGYSRKVNLWDVNTGEQTAVLKGHTEPIWTIDYSPDEKTIASGGRDGLVIIWDLVSGTEKNRSEAHQMGHRGNRSNSMVFVNGVVYSPNGQTLASGRNDAILLWEVATDKSIEIKTPKNLLCLSFHPYGSILASGHTDGVFLWNVKSGEQIAKLGGHEDSVQCVAFNPGGKILASGGQRDDKKIILWDVETTKEIASLTGHSKRVMALAFSPDGNTLVSGSGDGTVLIWDIAQYR